MIDGVYMSPTMREEYERAVRVLKKVTQDEIDALTDKQRGELAALENLAEHRIDKNLLIASWFEHHRKAAV